MLYGLPGAVKDELVGFLVHATQGPSVVAVHGPRYWPAGQATQSPELMPLVALRYVPAGQLVGVVVPRGQYWP